VPWPIHEHRSPEPFPNGAAIIALTIAIFRRERKGLADTVHDFELIFVDDGTGGCRFIGANSFNSITQRHPDTFRRQAATPSACRDAARCLAAS